MNEQVDPLVLDQPPHEHQVGSDRRALHGPIRVERHPVLHDPDPLRLEARVGQPLGGERGHRHVAVAQAERGCLGRAGSAGHEWPVGEVLVPVLAPELVPGRHHRDPGRPRGRPAPVQGHVRGGRAVDDVVSAARDGGHEPQRERRGLADGSLPVPAVQVRRPPHAVAMDRPIGLIGLSVPELPADQVHVVPVREPVGQLVDATLGAALQVRVQRVVDERDPQPPIGSRGRRRGNAHEPSMAMSRNPAIPNSAPTMSRVWARAA